MFFFTNICNIFTNIYKEYISACHLYFYSTVDMLKIACYDIIDRLNFGHSKLIDMHVGRG